MFQLPDRDSRDPHHRANSLEELLAWDDLDFVICAYVTVLGRRPDQIGRAHHLDLIRAGCSKLDLLQRLRESPEADSHDPGIAGFDRALTRAARERRHLMGFFLRLLRPHADSDARLDRSLRALLNAAKRHQRGLETIVEQLNGRTAIAESGVDAAVSSAFGRASQGMTLTIAGVPGIEVLSLTPDLDHLRKKRKSKQSVGGVAS